MSAEILPQEVPLRLEAKRPRSAGSQSGAPASACFKREESISLSSVFFDTCIVSRFPRRHKSGGLGIRADLLLAPSARFWYNR